MNFPLRGDEKFITSLKKGTPLYMVELSWNPNKSTCEVKVNSLIFDSYSEKPGQLDLSNDSYYGNMKTASGNIAVESHNLLYGFYESPRKAIEAFKAYAENMVKACDKAITKDNKRLEKLIKKLK